MSNKSFKMFFLGQIAQSCKIVSTIEASFMRDIVWKVALKKWRTIVVSSKIPSLLTEHSKINLVFSFFFDDSKFALKVAKFLNQNAPLQFCGSNFARHYYSMMSPTNLEMAHKAFTEPDGSCHILCATSGESTGIDHPDVRITVNKGGLHLILYERWTRDIKLDEYNNKELMFIEDPDRPHAILKKGSNKRNHLSRSGLESILAPCIREYCASYFGNSSSSRLDYNIHCCNGSAHVDQVNPFILQNYLLGKIWDRSMDRKENNNMDAMATDGTDDDDSI
ncbi:hypothetical protein BDP27DRAFT_1429646 [Rhodocollybia butyracea]|uniref:Uncharacterized protein n=1 Tax=Rhodocollybia butyracea TaxID=206335 RepID=A0A9P5PDK7_9AGAR|nr:hypothetical protein BDP27DRAFT_1429646 [Rhodocollybia butyracea]